jgi:hypothetical protein
VLRYAARRYVYGWRQKRLQNSADLVVQFVRDCRQCNHMIKAVRIYGYRVQVLQRGARYMMAIENARLELLVRQWNRAEPSVIVANNERKEREAERKKRLEKRRELQRQSKSGGMGTGAFRRGRTAEGPRPPPEPTASAPAASAPSELGRASSRKSFRERSSVIMAVAGALDASITSNASLDGSAIGALTAAPGQASIVAATVAAGEKQASSAGRATKRRGGLMEPEVRATAPGAAPLAPALIVPHSLKRSVLRENLRERLSAHRLEAEAHQKQLEIVMGEYYAAQHYEEMKNDLLERGAEVSASSKPNDQPPAQGSFRRGSFKKRTGARRGSLAMGSLYRTLSPMGTDGASLLFSSMYRRRLANIDLDGEIPPEVLAITGPKPFFNVLLSADEVRAAASARPPVHTACAHAFRIFPRSWAATSMTRCSSHSGPETCASAAPHRRRPRQRRPLRWRASRRR